MVYRPPAHAAAMPGLPCTPIRRGVFSVRGAMRTADFKSWEDVSEQLSFPAGTRHGTAFTVPKEVFDKLLAIK